MVWYQDIMNYWTMLDSYPWLQALIIILGFMLIAKVFQLWLVHILRGLTKKTKSDLDDIIVDLATRPIFYLICLVGIYLAILATRVLESYEAWVSGIFFVLMVLNIAWLGAKVFALITGRWFQRHRGATGTPKLLNIIAACIIYVAALIIVLEHFNVEITPFLAAMGVGGLAIGLALQDTLSNIFAGLHIISDEPVRVGDHVEIEGTTVSGVVKDIGWRSTRIRTFANNIIVVPNNTLANSVLINTTKPQQATKTTVLCGVDYGSDLAKVEKITLQVATQAQKKVEGAVPNFEPVVRFFNFGDNNVDFKIILEAKTRGDTFVLQHEFIKMLHQRFAKENIDISWPVRKVYDMTPGKKK